MQSTTKKLHTHPHCGRAWWDRETNRVVSLSEVTCGICKGRILERIRAMDWDDLPLGVLAFFAQLQDETPGENP